MREVVDYAICFRWNNEEIKELLPVMIKGKNGGLRGKCGPPSF